MSRLPVRTLVVVACGALLVASGAPQFVDVDVWHLMALAREVLALGRMPLEDRFAYTPTVYPVVQHEWGSGMILYFLGMHGGVVALQAARVVLAALLVAGAVRVARSRGATTATLAALAPLAIVMSWIGLTAIRPQLFTLAFLSLWLWLIERDRRGDRTWIGVAVVSQVVWQNLHAGFVVGWGFLALHAAEQVLRGRPARHLLALAPVLVGLVALNPYGVAYYGYLAHGLMMERALIGEWQPIWRANPVAVAVFGLSVVLAVGALGRTGVWQTPGWPIVAVAGYLAASHERHVSIWALVWFAYVPAMLAATRLGHALDRLWRSPPTPVTRAVGAVLLAVSVSAFVGHRSWRLVVPGTSKEGAPSPYPVGPVAYLQNQSFSGNVLVPFVVGAFVSWKLYPDVKVSIDTRYEVAYPPERLVEHVRFYGADPGWETLLSRYPTDLVLVRHTDPVAPKMTTQTAWRPVFRDDAFVLYARPGLALPVENWSGHQLLGSYP